MTNEDRCQLPPDLDLDAAVDLELAPDDPERGGLRTASKDYADALRAALEEWCPGRVRYLKGWDTRHRGIGWRAPRGVPSALMVHHTGGARTESQNPANPGNRPGADAGVVAYVQGHYDVPAANFTLDRSGTLWVHSAFPVWHAGLGSFRRVHPFDRLGIPDNAANDHVLGVEVVSKGRTRDFTRAQTMTLGDLANAARDASGWPSLTARLPEHETWAPRRKIDTRYPRTVFLEWARLSRERVALAWKAPKGLVSSVSPLGVTPPEPM